MKITFRVLRPVDFSDEVIQKAVINLGMKSGTWQEPDREYYRDQFLNPENINIICQNEDDVIVGYILAKPHNEAVHDYMEEDPAMTKCSIKMFYVDIVIVDKSASGKSFGLKLIIEMIKESNRRGVFRFSMHCRVINGLSRIIQHKFKEGLDFVRRIERYIDCNDEPFDYMEIVVNL